MSFDRQLEQVCPHLVVEELLYVNSDLTTVIPMRPIASSGSVVVRVNGIMEVPSFGVDIPAQSRASREGPYTVTSGVNDRIKYQVNNNLWQEVTIPAASRVTSQRIADLINSQIQGWRFYADGNGLTFRTDLSGQDSTLMFASDSVKNTLIPYLGIRSNRQFRGKRTFPGWSLVTNPNSLSDRPLLMVIFDEPLQAMSNYVEVNYTTVRQECRRCGGLGVENDWRYARDGNVIESRDETLLIQEIQKITYTSRGSNPFHSWYGSSIVEQIGQKLVTGGVIQNRIISDINTAFNRWQSVKKQQEGASIGQFVSDGEFPFRLLGVSLDQSQQDPTVLFVNLTIQNRSLKQIQLSRGIRVPLPQDLLGSTQQQEILKGLQPPPLLG
jgi:phage baseplate assembly protein W